MTTKSLPQVEKLRNVLRGILRSSPYVRAAAIIRLSGETIASVMPYDVAHEQVSAISAVMLTLGERLTAAMKSGELSKIYIEGETGHIVLMAITSEAVLSVMASEEMPLGLLLLDMELALEKLKPLL